MPRKRGLTDKQRCFVEEYLIDLNAKRAAIRAGFSPRSAEKYGNQLLHSPRVRDSVDQAIAERSRRTGIHQDRVVQELARVAFVNPKDIINFQTGCVKPDASDDDIAVIASCKVKVSSMGDNGEMIEREVRLVDKLKALDMLCRHLGMYGDGKGGPAGADSSQGEIGVIQMPAVMEVPEPPSEDDGT